MRCFQSIILILLINGSFSVADETHPSGKQTSQKPESNKPKIYRNPGSLTGMRGKDHLDKSYHFLVVGKQGGTVWGTGVYTDDSSLAAAVVHAGLVAEGKTGIVKVTIVAGRDTYKGSTKNGVTTRDYGAWGNSYRVEAADLPDDFIKKAIKVAKAKPHVLLAKRSWGPEQAVGAPNTPAAGDYRTAWASATQDGQDEWLELEYAESVTPEFVLVHETYNPGALYRVTGYTKSGMEAELWAGKDPTERTADRGVSAIKVDLKMNTKRIRVWFKSTEVAGWNEIDAVGVKDEKGKVQWAVWATASSTYADR